MNEPNGFIFWSLLNDAQKKVLQLGKIEIRKKQVSEVRKKWKNKRLIIGVKKK